MTASNIPVLGTAEKLETWKNDLGAGDVHTEATTPTNSAGLAMATGAGAVDTTVPRVTLASDDPAVTQLAAILAAIQALSIAAAVPLLVHSGETYEVPTNTQVAYAHQMVAEAGGIILTTGTGTLTWID